MARSKQPTPAILDFESMGVEGRPVYPPVPVGVAIKYPGKKARYYGFGHVEGNNSTWPEACDALIEAYQWGCTGINRGLLFHHANFDLDVADVHMGLPIPAWDYVHDSQFLLYLDDPHQREMGLKPSSERLLNMPPDEQDEVCEWLLENQPIPSIKITRGKGGEHYFGKYIAFAPGDIVGKYAIGDVDRTEKLFKLLWKKTCIDRKMLGAYNRERKLRSSLLQMERQGVPVDLDRLRSDVQSYGEWLLKLDAWIIKTIKAPGDINLNSADQLVEAMVSAGKADPDLLPKTKTGKFATSKEALLQGVTDPQLLAVLKYRTQLNTCLNTFMKPWLATAERSLEYGIAKIFTTWNQIKSTEGVGSIGTRTGRLSSTPSLMNIPKEFEAIFRHDNPSNKSLPRCPWKDLPVLPKVRNYIVPFPGHVLVDRDISQQELRVLAHFDGEVLQESYLKNPWIDFHDFTKDELAKMGKHYDRKPVKNTGLGIVYGLGVGKLAIKNNMSVIEAGELKNAVLKLYPGLKQMYNDMKTRAKNNVPIRTWGGREYYCEAPRIVEGRLREFDYKLVNVLIQGSAADCTKQAIINWFDLIEDHDDWFLVLNVHDQLTASVPIKDLAIAMELLRVSIEKLPFDVPMLSEGSTGFNWAALEDYDKKGRILKCGTIYENVAPSVMSYTRQQETAQNTALLRASA